MSCCGQNRQRIRELDSSQPMPGLSPADNRTPRAPSLSLVYFEYVGRTGLTVTGPITGKRYRFPKPGDKVAVDSNDAPSLAVVPNLQQTRSP
jgi:hypothetical protein